MERSPVVMVDGRPETMPSGDAIPVANGGTGATDATGARTNLGVQATLTGTADVPGLDTALAGKATLPGSLAAADLFYWNGSALARLPKGTDGQFLSLASGVPVWADGGGMELIGIVEGTCTANATEQTIGTVVAPATGDYRLVFRSWLPSSPGSNTYMGHRFNAGSTVRVVSEQNGVSGYLEWSRVVTATVSDNIRLRASIGSWTSAHSFSMEVYQL